MRTRPAGMRSSGSPGSWPPSAAEFRCVSLTLHSHLKTSNLFPESGGMFMAANWTFLTSHAPARGRIGTPSARGWGQCPRPFPPGLLQPPRGPADPRQHPPLPPARLDPLADRHPPVVPAAFRKQDAAAVLTGPSLPVLSGAQPAAGGNPPPPDPLIDIVSTCLTYTTPLSPGNAPAGLSRPPPAARRPARRTRGEPYPVRPQRHVADRLRAARDPALAAAVAGPGPGDGLRSSGLGAGAA